MWQAPVKTSRDPMEERAKEWASGVFGIFGRDRGKGVGWALREEERERAREREIRKQSQQCF
eukprot:1329231-Alexandrium_andersonii.AAC.1